MDRVPIWRLTRTAYGRRLWETLTACGITLTRLRLYRRTVLAGVAGSEPEPEITLTVRCGTELDRHGMALPVASEDRLVEARADGQAVGSLVLSIDRRVRVDPLDTTLAIAGGYLWALFVEPAYRQRGIASALVAHALQVAAGKTDTCLALVAPDNRPSQRVFEGQGFTAAGAVTHVSLPGVRWTSGLDDLDGVRKAETSPPSE